MEMLVKMGGGSVSCEIGSWSSIITSISVLEIIKVLIPFWSVHEIS